MTKKREGALGVLGGTLECPILGNLVKPGQGTLSCKTQGGRCLKTSGETRPYLFQCLQIAHIPLLVTPSFTNSSPLAHIITSLTLPPFAKDPWDSTGITQIAQNHLFMPKG